MGRARLLLGLSLLSVACGTTDPAPDGAIADAGSADAASFDAPGADGGRLDCAEPGSRGLGEPCRCAETDCALGLLCLTEEVSGIPGGMCVQAVCSLSADECMGDTRCVGIPGNSDEGMCMAACTSNDDCRPTVGVCNTGAPGGGICHVMCQAVEDCESTGFCDPYTSACTEPREPVGADTWQTCLRNDDCRSNYCAPIGRCGTNCSVSRQGCPDGQICVELETGNDFSLCFRTCSGPADCPDPTLDCVRTSAGDRVCGPAA